MIVSSLRRVGDSWRAASDDEVRCTGNEKAFKLSPAILKKFFRSAERMLTKPVGRGAQVKAPRRQLKDLLDI